MQIFSCTLSANIHDSYESLFCFIYDHFRLLFSFGFYLSLNIIQLLELDRKITKKQNERILNLDERQF